MFFDRTTRKPPLEWRPHVAVRYETFEPGLYEPGVAAPGVNLQRVSVSACADFGQVLGRVVDGESPGDAYWSGKMTIGYRSRLRETRAGETMGAFGEAGYMCGVWDGVYPLEARKGC